MREIRIDPTTGDEVVLSTSRRGRPNHLRAGRLARTPPEECPFCPGHEPRTPPLIAERGGAEGWNARAFANRYPALGLEEPARGRAMGPYGLRGGFGAHEVIVEAREHEPPVWQAPDGGAAALGLARDRMVDLSRDSRLKHFCWFRNVGPEAGGSMSHPHAQLVALPRVTARMQRILDRFQAYEEQNDRELMQDILDFELQSGERMVIEGSSVVAFCPYAPQMPFEVWFVPTVPQASWLEEGVPMAELADTMRRVLAAMGKALEIPSYNACLFQAPVGGSRGFRWHVRLLPRLSSYGGFELISGAMLHGVPPEEAAKVLRDDLR